MGKPHLCEDEAGKSFFAEPVAVFLADQQDRLANFLQMLGHCLLDGIGVVFFQRGKNIEVLTEQHFRRGDVIEAHVTYAVDSGLDIFDGVPCQLAVGNGCQFLVKIVIQLEEIIQLFALNGNPLLIEILLKLIALAVGDLGCGPARYRSYVYEPGTFRPLALLQGEGEAAEPIYYQLDHLGTPQELTSASGQILWSVKYRAYGSLAKVEVNGPHTDALFAWLKAQGKGYQTRMNAILRQEMLRDLLH